MLEHKEIKEFIDKNRPITQMPGYGMVDLNKYIPSDEEVLVNMIYYMSYWDTYWMFDYIPETDFSNLVRLYLEDWYYDCDARQYKHIIVNSIRNNRGLFEYNSLDINEDDIEYIYEWGRNEGRKHFREYKLKLILDE